MRNPSDRFAAGAFVLSLVIMAALYGVFAQRWGWFPTRQIDLAERTINDAMRYWKNDIGLEPTRHLVAARTPRQAPDDDGYRVHMPGAATPGYVLVAGLSPDQDVTSHAVTLYDQDGKQLHRWPVDYAMLDDDPEGLNPRNVMLHGMEVFPDGSLAVTFDAGNVVARIDACGQPIWARDGGFHHSIVADGQGGLWSWRDLDIVRLDAATGEIGATLSLPDQIMSAEGFEGVFAIRSFAAAEKVSYEADPFHSNDVEPLRPEMAAAFPMFQAGDLLISLRELNLVAVIEPTEGRLRWWRHGPWQKQHDPDFQPDGTISVFDNRTGIGPSRILRVSPATNDVTTAFEGSEAVPFYSWQRGKHQVLPNGNILVTEAEHGRIFEASPAGELIWERDLVWDADRNLVVTEARHVPPDFFEDGIPSCDGLTTASVETGSYRQ